MNYKRIYDLLIERAKNRDLGDEIYFEYHHIVPECFYKNRKRKGKPGHLEGDPNSPDNIVKLTAKEHYIAHILLYKIHKNKKTFFALWKMCHGKCSGFVNSRRYEKLRIEASELNSGDKNPMFGVSSKNKGVPRSEETKRKISKSKKGKKLSESHIKNIKETRKHEPLSGNHRKKVSESMKGLKKTDTHKKNISLSMKGMKRGIQSDEHKDKISKSLTGRKFTDEHKRKLSIFQKGVKRSPLSEQHKKNVSESLIGIPKPQVTCPHCNKKGGSGTMGRWHFDNCRNK